MFFLRTYLGRVLLGLLLLVGCGQSDMYGMGLYRMVERGVAYATKPTHTPVFMNHSNMIRLPAGAKNNPIISTGGLVGCIPALLYIRNKDLSQRLIMSHYAHTADPIENEADLLEHMEDLSTEHIDYAHFVVVVPTGSNAFFDEIEEGKCQSHRARLQELVRNNLNVQRLEMSSSSYRLGFVGQMPAQVEAHLSGGDKKPSGYTIWTAYGKSSYSFIEE